MLGTKLVAVLNYLRRSTFDDRLNAVSIERGSRICII